MYGKSEFGRRLRGCRKVVKLNKTSLRRCLCLTQTSDAVIIALYDSEKQKAFNGTVIAEQVQLGTQRMNEQSGIQDPNHNSLFEPTPVDQIETKYDKEEFVITKLHYETPDGEWVCEEYTYKYRLEITGRMNQAAKNTTYIVLSNTEEITFDQT